MKHVKIISPGWETFSSHLGMVQFENGVSVEPVTRNVADRLAASVRLVELDDDGNESPCGAAQRIVGGASDTYTPTSLSRASADELADEQRRIEESADKMPTSKLYTVDELRAIADEHGIQGLREIGDKWRVRDRAINGLIREIVKAQKDWVARVEAATGRPTGEREVQKFEMPSETSNAVGENGEPVNVQPAKPAPTSDDEAMEALKARVRAINTPPASIQDMSPEEFAADAPAPDAGDMAQAITKAAADEDAE